MFTSLLEPGDMILTTSKIFFGSNYSIHGSFKHLIVYAGPVEGQLDGEFITHPRSLLKNEMVPKLDMSPSYGYFKRAIVHAISEGVRCQDLFDIWRHYDYIIAVRASDDPAVRRRIVAQALSEVGRDYDFSPSPGELSRYCTELGAAACRVAGLDAPEQTPYVTKFWKPWARNPVWLADSFVFKYQPLCATMSCRDSSLPSSSIDPDRMRRALLEVPLLEPSYLKRSSSNLPSSSLT